MISLKIRDKLDLEVSLLLCWFYQHLLTSSFCFYQLPADRHTGEQNGILSSLVIFCLFILLSGFPPGASSQALKL